MSGSYAFWTPEDVKRARGQVLIGELHRVLSNARIFAAKDGIMPMLHSVHLESTGTHLVASGTDRFMLGASATPYADDKWNTLLPIPQVDTLLLALKTAMRFSHWQTAKLDRSIAGYRFKVDIAVRYVGEVYDESRDASTRFSFPTRMVDDAGMKFPAWRQLLKAPKDGQGPVTFSVDPTKMAKFAQVKGAGHQMYVSAYSPSKAIRISMGEGFIGLVMPVRANEDNIGEAEPKWL